MENKSLRLNHLEPAFRTETNLSTIVFRYYATPGEEKANTLKVVNPKDRSQAGL